VKGLPPGEHAFHVHAVGKCDPPFDSAGGHFNPDGKKHGLMVLEGHHAGDMPNLHIPQSGELVVEVLNPAVTLEQGKPNSIFGPNGTAIVIHAGVDDYRPIRLATPADVLPAASSSSSRASGGSLASRFLAAPRMQSQKSSGFGEGNQLLRPASLGGSACT
jgi:Cu/Zn superoxide dismutase